MKKYSAFEEGVQTIRRTWQLPSPVTVDGIFVATPEGSDREALEQLWPEDVVAAMKRAAFEQILQDKKDIDSL